MSWVIGGLAQAVIVAVNVALYAHNHKAGHLVVAVLWAYLALVFLLRSRGPWAT